MDVLHFLFLGYFLGYCGISGLRGCLYGGEPARVPELARLAEVNFTTRLYDTFEAGGLFAKTNISREI